MMKPPTLRLEDCGDWLNVAQFCAWTGQAPNTVYKRVSRGACKVPPASLTPLRWRRTDCERYLKTASVMDDRKTRAQRKYGVRRVS